MYLATFVASNHHNLNEIIYALLKYICEFQY